MGDASGLQIADYFNKLSCVKAENLFSLLEKMGALVYQIDESGEATSDSPL
jgi:hypothetical protein